MSTVTRIGGKSDKPPAELPPGFERAIEEQQSRVWRLRSLLGMALRAEIGDAATILADQEAVLEGLLEYADEVHLALDIALLKDRAAQIAQEEAKEKQP